MQEEKEQSLENKDRKERDPGAITVGNLVTSGGNCSKWTKRKGDSNKKESRSAKVQVNGAEVRRRDSSSSDGEV